MIINKETLDSVYTNFRADFEAGILSAKSVHERLAMVTRSATREEDYGWLGQYNRLREWLGDKHLNGLVAHGFTIKNRPFENTITVPRDDIEDDRIGVLSSAFKMMGQDASLHPDELIFDLIRNGTTQPCYDGQYFFDTDHPADLTDPSKGVISNVDVVNPADAPEWVLLDTSKVVKPLVFQIRRDYRFVRMDGETDEAVFMRAEYRYGVEARVNAGYGLWQLAFGSNKTLSYENYSVAREAMMSLKAPTGKPLGIIPDVILVSPSLEGSARTLLKTDAINDGAMKDTAEIIVCPWLG